MRASILLQIPIYQALCWASPFYVSGSALEQREIKYYNADTPGAVQYTVGPDHDICNASVPLNTDSACVFLRSLEWLAWAMANPAHAIHKASPREVYAERHKGQGGALPVLVHGIFLWSQTLRDFSYAVEATPDMDVNKQMIIAGCYLDYVTQANKWLKVIEEKAELYKNDDPIRSLMFDRIEALYFSYVRAAALLYSDDPALHPLFSRNFPEIISEGWMTKLGSPTPGQSIAAHIHALDLPVVGENRLFWRVQKAWRSSQRSKDVQTEAAADGKAEDKPADVKAEDKPTDGKPADDKAERKATDDKAGDKPVDGKAEDKPKDNKVEGKAADNKAEDKPKEGKVEDKPTDDKVEDKPKDSKAEGEPKDGKVEDKPADGKAEDKPADEGKAADGKAGDEPKDNKVEDEPADAKAEDKSKDNKAEDKPADVKVEGEPTDGKAENQGGK